MSDATPIKLQNTGLEVQLAESAEEKYGLELEEDEEFWIPVLATYVQDKKLFLVLALPWAPESGEPEGEEAEWFAPTTVTENEIHSARFAPKEKESDR